MPIFNRKCAECGAKFKTRNRHVVICEKCFNKPVVNENPLPPVPFPNDAKKVEEPSSFDVATDHDEFDRFAIDSSRMPLRPSYVKQKPAPKEEDKRKVLDPKTWKPTPLALKLIADIEAREREKDGFRREGLAPTAEERIEAAKKREDVWFEGRLMTRAAKERLIWEREHPVRYCKRCGRQFALNGKDDDNEFCSADCYATYQATLKREAKERKEAEERQRKWDEEERIAKHGIPCPICGTKFLRKKQRGRKQLYCSTKCAATANYRKTHPNWKDPKDHPTDLKKVEWVFSLPVGERWKHCKNFNDEEMRHLRSLAQSEIGWTSPKGGLY